MSFLSVDGTLIVQLINFAIFFAVLNVVFLRPVAAAIRRRREYINSLVSDYDRYQAEARSLRAEAESIRGEARRDAENRVAAARAQASNEAAELSGRYARQAQDIVEAAQRKAQEELEAARAGEDEAARRVADFMLDRVIPEAAQ
ncbi:MAG: ATP synthase F0 subunit B [Candidatus Eremiobacteraeota bacterium]|nr:ATP synthase F0 subunit B [Candidatus Eremiobacteraeota bacterium]MBV8497918.1 ATP synthase F0 subunit B [Candidatus Eremiobacteraeota bacterium]